MTLPAQPAHPLSATIAEELASWPHVTVDIKWQTNLVFSIANKMFAVISLDDTPFERISFKAGTERFLELTDKDGIIPAPYMARNHWVTVTDPKALSQKSLLELLRSSHDQVVAKLPKKIQLQLRA